MKPEDQMALPGVGIAHLITAGPKEVISAKTPLQAEILAEGLLRGEVLIPKREERDPHGRDPHAGGAKLDAGKVRPALVVDSFARALLKIAEVGTFGADKYTDDGWCNVPDGVKRYNDAKIRHMLKGAFEDDDPDSGLSHLAHEAWNILAVLELKLRQAEGQ